MFAGKATVFEIRTRTGSIFEIDYVLSFDFENVRPTIGKRRNVDFSLGEFVFGALFAVCDLFCMGLLVILAAAERICVFVLLAWHPLE